MCLSGPTLAIQEGQSVVDKCLLTGNKQKLAASTANGDSV